MPPEWTKKFLKNNWDLLSALSKLKPQGNPFLSMKEKFDAGRGNPFPSDATTTTTNALINLKKVKEGQFGNYNPDEGSGVITPANQTGKVGGRTKRKRKKRRRKTRVKRKKTQKRKKAKRKYKKRRTKRRR